MGELSQLPNIGVVVEEQLNAIGVFTKTDLESLGSQEAWLRIKEQDPSACYHRLLALEGALQNKPKKMLSAEDKLWLKQFYQDNRG